MMLWMAPFTMEVECKIVPVRADWSPMTLPDATRCSRCRPLFLLKSSSAEIFARAAIMLLHSITRFCDTVQLRAKQIDLFVNFLNWHLSANG